MSVAAKLAMLFDGCRRASCVALQQASAYFKDVARNAQCKNPHSGAKMEFISLKAHSAERFIASSAP